MTIMGKTHFTYLKSSKNKISSRNCIFLFVCLFVRLVWCKTARPQPVPDCQGKDFNQTKRGVKAAQLASSPSGKIHVSHGKTRSAFAYII